MRAFKIKKSKNTLIFLFLFIINFFLSKEACPNNEPYKYLDSCTSICNIDDIFENNNCIPVSTSNEDIETMYENIQSYINAKAASITNEIRIIGEDITYQIIKEDLILTNTNIGSLVKLNLGHSCLDKIISSLSDTIYFLVLVNIINSDYTSSIKGIKIIYVDLTTPIDISDICKGETISLKIPVNIPVISLLMYDYLKNEYNYDILDLRNPFYTDICKVFSTKDKLDMSLSKRIEEIGSFAINVCAENCEYEKFDSTTYEVYCKCYIVEDSQNKENKNIGEQIYDKIKEFLDLINFDVMFCHKLVFSVGIKKMIKNFGFMIMTISVFLLIICMISTFCVYKNRIIKFIQNFNQLKTKFKNVYLEETGRKIEEENGGNNNNQNEIVMVNPITPPPQNSINENENNIIPNDNKQNPKKEEEKEEEEEEEEEEDDEEEEEEDDEEEEEEEDDDGDEKKNIQKNNDKDKVTPKEIEEDKIIPKEIEEDKKEENIINEDKKDNDNKLYEEPKKYDEISEIKIPPRKIEQENVITRNPQPYIDYNKYLRDYANYLNYMQYCNYINQYYTQLSNNLKNNYFNYNPQPQIQPSPPPPPQNNNQAPIKPNEFGKLELVIPYDKIKEKVKEKKSKDKTHKKTYKNTRHRKKTKLKKKNNKKNDLVNDEGIKKKKIKKTKKTKKTKVKNNGEVKNKIENIKENLKKHNNKKSKGNMKFEINLEELFKPNPPKHAKSKYINNNEPPSSGKEELNGRQILDLSRKVDSSDDNFSEIKNISRSNIRLKSNKSSKSNGNGIVLYNNNPNNVNNEKGRKRSSRQLHNENDNTKIRENEEKNSENKNEMEIKFGSEEFYKYLMKLPIEKRAQFFEDEELTRLEYQYAIDIDRRSYCQLYFSLLKRQNILIYCLSFCSNDLNLGIVKFSLFLFQIVLHILISALFFTDNTLNHIYNKKNKFDFAFMVRILGLTFIICWGVDFLFKLLARTDSMVIDIKKRHENLNEGLSGIRCKFLFYYIFILIISLFAWYYISCFCAVYSHTQLILFKSAIYSFAVSVVYPFFLCLIPPMFRNCALGDQNKESKCLYEFSKIISYI